jgi:hypothetical protein
MTCFWDGLIQALIKSQTNLLGITNILGITGKLNAVSFSESLKKKNCMTDNIIWNNESLSEQFKQENMQMISDFELSTINKGYLCSSCDPFLLLISQIFRIDINHDYNGYNIIYKNSQSNGNNINVSSNKGHFWCN